MTTETLTKGQCQPQTQHPDAKAPVLNPAWVNFFAESERLGELVRSQTLQEDEQRKAA